MRNITDVWMRNCAHGIYHTNANRNTHIGVHIMYVASTTWKKYSRFQWISEYESLEVSSLSQTYSFKTKSYIVCIEANELVHVIVIIEQADYFVLSFDVVALNRNISPYV